MHNCTINCIIKYIIKYFLCVFGWHYLHNQSFLYRAFIKYLFFSLKCCDFPELCQFCCSAGFLPVWCVYTHWRRRKTEKGQSPEYFKIFGKNTILNEHPVYKHTRFPKIINLFLNRKFISHLSLSSRKIIIGAKQLVLYIFRVTMYADLIALVWHFHWLDNDFFCSVVFYKVTIIYYMDVLCRRCIIFFSYSLSIVVMLIVINIISRLFSCIVSSFQMFISTNGLFLPIFWQ